MNKSQYKNHLEWKKACPKDYQRAVNTKVLDKICELMGWPLPKKQPKKTVPHGFFKIKENVLADAKKYGSPGEWAKESSAAYKTAKKENWFEEATAHMEYKIKPSEYWDIKENVLESSSKYDKENAWKHHCISAYNGAIRNNWLEEATAHMKKPTRKPPGYWNKERCMEDAQPHDMPERWKKSNPTAYAAARRNNWFKECTAHMKGGRGLYTKEKCMESASKYEYPYQWKKAEPKLYGAARNNRWYHDCTAHMKKKTRKSKNN